MGTCENSKRAAPLLRSTLALKLERLPADHPDIALTRTNLAAILRDKGELDEAAGLLDAAIATYRGLGHPDLANALFGLGRLLLKRADPVAAEPPLREAVAIRVARVPKQIKTAEAKSVLGECLSAQGRYAEAEPLLLEAVEQLKTAAGVKPERLYHATARLRRLYEDWSRPEEAARWQREMDAANEAEIAEGGRWRLTGRAWVLRYACKLAAAAVSACARGYATGEHHHAAKGRGHHDLRFGVSRPSNRLRPAVHRLLELPSRHDRNTQSVAARALPGGVGRGRP